MNTTYNGWTNYETWAVKLWMDNDRGSYEYWQERARANTDGEYNLSQELKSEHEDAMPEVPGVFADLLSAALSEVNWYEIAESLLEDAKETA